MNEPSKLVALYARLATVGQALGDTDAAVDRATTCLTTVREHYDTEAAVVNEFDLRRVVEAVEDSLGVVREATTERATRRLAVEDCPRLVSIAETAVAHGDDVAERRVESIRALCDDLQS